MNGFTSGFLTCCMLHNLSLKHYGWAIANAVFLTISLVVWSYDEGRKQA